jgi:glyoxylate reductase
MNVSKKVLITRIIPSIAKQILADAGFDVTVWDGDPMTADELIRESKKVNALLSLGSNKIDKAFLNQCRHLEVIAQFAVGYDNIDVPEATRLGIPISNTPDVLSAATADVAFGLMINVSRKMFYHHKSILQGKWKQFEPLKDLGVELTGKTLGIFGLGRIGMVMAQRCKGAFNMDVIYHNRSRNLEAEQKLGARWVSLVDLMKQSDVVSVHCALSAETKGIFNHDVFQRMKSSAIFINTSRGAIHNEQDLIEALTSGTIWGAGLDVTNPEPMQPNNPLLSMPNVAVLPHIGSATVEARNGMARLAAENIIGFYRDRKMPTCLNPEVLK